MAGERRRFSYGRLCILLQREGFVVNHKKLFRLYREEGLAVRQRRGRKRALETSVSGSGKSSEGAAADRSPTEGNDRGKLRTH